MWHVALSWPARAWSKPVVFEPAYYVVPHANDARVAFASACDNAFDNVDNRDVYICIYILEGESWDSVVSFSWWWVRKNYSFLIFTFVSIFEVFILNVGSKIVKNWMEIISEDSIRETKTFLFFILLMNIVESILLLSMERLLNFIF